MLQSQHQNNEFVWVIQGSALNTLTSFFTNQPINIKAILSPTFTQCGSEWILELTRNQRYREYIKLICKKLPSHTQHIYVNYFIEFDDKRYYFGDTFSKNKLLGYPQPSVRDLQHILENMKKKNVNQLRIKCGIEKTMSFKEKNNGEFTWCIPTIAKYIDYNTPTNYHQQYLRSPIFRGSNGTEWDIQISRYLPPSNGKVYLSLDLRHVPHSLKGNAFGVMCTFQIKEIKQVTESVGVFNISQRGAFIGTENGMRGAFIGADSCSTVQSYKYGQISMDSFRNLQTCTITAKLKFIYNSDANWNINGDAFKQFKACSYNHAIYSPYFMVGDVMWRFKVFPNGRPAPKQDDFGNFRCFQIQSNFFQLGDGVIYLYKAATLQYNNKYLIQVRSPQLNYHCTVSPERVTNDTHIVLPAIFKYAKLQSLDQITIRLNVNSCPVMEVTKNWCLEQKEMDSNKIRYEIAVCGLKWIVQFNGNRIILQLCKYPLSVSSITITFIPTIDKNYVPDDMYDSDCSPPKLYPDITGRITTIKYHRNGKMKHIVQGIPIQNGKTKLIHICCSIQIIDIEYDTKYNNAEEKEEKEEKTAPLHTINKNDTPQWACKSCTFLNPLSNEKCEMCSASVCYKQQINISAKTMVDNNGKNEAKIQEIMDLNKSLKKENKRLITSASIQRKEYEQKINSLQLEIQTLNSKSTGFDTKNWRDWDSNDILKWIVWVHNKRFAKYENIVSIALTEQQVTGQDLPTINEMDIYQWGIKVLKDKKALNNAIQQLTKQQNEGLNDHSTVFL